MNGKVVTVDLNFGGVVNGLKLDVHGVSHGVFKNGHIDCQLRANKDIPKNMCIGLLAYVGLTGQPAMSDVIEGAENPFLGTGGAYKATRSIDLGSSGFLTTEYRVGNTGTGRLGATFDVRGHVNVPRLTNIHPCIETWTPVGPGRINGQFTMVWDGANGERIQGKTNTDYILPTNDNIVEQQFREIRINIDTSEPGRLLQTEHIALFAPNFLERALNSTPRTTEILKETEAA